MLCYVDRRAWRIFPRPEFQTKIQREIPLFCRSRKFPLYTLSDSLYAIDELNPSSRFDTITAYHRDRHRHRATVIIPG